MRTLLAGVTALALLASPVIAADTNAISGKTTNSDPSAKQPNTGSDGASSGTEIVGQYADEGCWSAVLVQLPQGYLSFVASVTMSDMQTKSV